MRSSVSSTCRMPTLRPMIMSLLRRHIPLADEGGTDEMCGGARDTCGSAAGGGSDVVGPSASKRMVRMTAAEGKRIHWVGVNVVGGPTPQTMMGTVGSSDESALS